MMDVNTFRYAMYDLGFRAFQGSEDATGCTVEAEHQGGRCLAVHGKDWAQVLEQVEAEIHGSGWSFVPGPPFSCN